LTAQDQKLTETELAEYQDEILPVENGLTPRTALVILYGAFILMPANLYLLLVSGQGLVGGVNVIALILWVELCKFTRKPLTTAEAFIVYSVSAIAASQLLFANYVMHQAYFRISPDTNNLFIQTKEGVKSLAAAAPTWWAPPREAVLTRSLFHRAWLVPLGVTLITWVCHLLANVSLGILGRELFVKGEKLPFPFARPAAEACKALTRENPDIKKAFTLAGFVGAMWGVVVFYPVLLGSKLINYPIPWADFGSRMHGLLPGAVLGLATSVAHFTGGFIIRFRVIVSMLIGALAIQVFGNVWAYKTGRFDTFIPGMSIESILVQQIWIWMSVFIAAFVAAGLIHIFARPKELVNAFRGLLKTRDAAAAERTLSLAPLLITFAMSTAISVVLFRFLIDDFPWWLIAPFSLLWSFVFSLIDARAIGTTGYRIDPPYVREGLIVASGYKGSQVWFAPWPVSLGASSWVQNFKICELTGCLPRSYIKAALLAAPVGMIGSFVFMSIFWSVAPIPSATYPYTRVLLPRWTRQMCVWISTTAQVVPRPERKAGGGKGDESAPSGQRPQAAGANAAATFDGEDLVARARGVFKGKWMAVTFAVFLAIYAFGRIVPAASLSLIGLAVGMAGAVPFALSLFVGGIIAIIVRRLKGPAWFQKYRYVIVAGLLVGQGVVIGLSAAIAALKNSLIALPY